VLAYAIPPDAGTLPGVLGACPAEGQGPVAYVCRGLSCSAPVHAVEDLLARLQEQ
jgi:hypothetical protein